MKTEYLITFELNSGLCTSIDKFKTLLSSHQHITFKKDKLSKKDKLLFQNTEFPIIVADGILPDDSIYYDLTIECVGTDQNEIDKFSKLLKEIRTICQNVSNRSIITLQDGVGEVYCHLGYPIIFKTETLMRKLISKFMAISVGYDWKNSATPKEVLDSVRIKTESNNKGDFLQEVDFIQLSNFLFKKYVKINATEFISSLKEKPDDETITIKEIRKYSPYTNWERYFAHIVKCGSDFLEKRWEKLYDYRCKIAHCRGISKDELNNLIKTSDEVIEKIQSALDSIDDIRIDEQEKEELAENLSGVANEHYATFISQYNKLLYLLRFVCESVSDEKDSYSKHKTNTTNVSMQAYYLFKNKRLIDKNSVDNIIQAQRFRNKIVHQVGISDIQENQITENINEINSLINCLAKFQDDELHSLKGVDYSNE